MTIRVTVGNNMKRDTILVDDSKTPRQVLEENDIDYTTGVTSLDGCALAPGFLDKTFSDIGITEKCVLTNVVKADNA